ncbi:MULTISPECIES: hypothetical protein [unclassified Leptolyngbya]|nr:MULTISPECIES: hypothetical protein [unclassified Leptolyngbya]
MLAFIACWLRPLPLIITRKSLAQRGFYVHQKLISIVTLIFVAAKDGMTLKPTPFFCRNENEPS